MPILNSCEISSLYKKYSRLLIDLISLSFNEKKDSG